MKALLWMVLLICGGLLQQVSCAPQTSRSTLRTSTTRSSTTQYSSSSSSTTLVPSTSFTPTPPQPGSWILTRDDKPASGVWNMTRGMPFAQNRNTGNATTYPTVVVITRFTLPENSGPCIGLAVDLPIKRGFPQNQTALGTDPGQAHFFLWDDTSDGTPPQGLWPALTLVVREFWTLPAPTFNNTWSPPRALGVYRFERTLSFGGPLASNRSYWLGVFIEQSRYGNANNTLYWLAANGVVPDGGFWYVDIHGDFLANGVFARPQMNVTAAPSATTFYANTSLTSLSLTVFADCPQAPTVTALLPDPSLDPVVLNGPPTAESSSTTTSLVPTVQPTAIDPNATTAASWSVGSPIGGVTILPPSSAPQTPPPTVATAATNGSVPTSLSPPSTSTLLSVPTSSRSSSSNTNISGATPSPASTNVAIVPSVSSNGALVTTPSSANLLESNQWFLGAIGAAVVLGVIVAVGFVIWVVVRRRRRKQAGLAAFALLHDKSGAHDDYTDEGDVVLQPMPTDPKKDPKKVALDDADDDGDEDKADSSHSDEENPSHHIPLDAADPPTI